MQVVVVPYPFVPCHARSSFHLKIRNKRRWKIWKIWNWKSWKNWILFDLFVWFVNVSWRILPGCHGIHHHQSPFGGDLLLFPKPPTRKTRVLDPHEGAKRPRGKVASIIWKGFPRVASEKRTHLQGSFKQKTVFRSCKQGETSPKLGIGMTFRAKPRIP